MNDTVTANEIDAAYASWNDALDEYYKASLDLLNAEISFRNDMSAAYISGTIGEKDHESRLVHAHGLFKDKSKHLADMESNKLFQGLILDLAKAEVQRVQARLRLAEIAAKVE